MKVNKDRVLLSSDEYLNQIDVYIEKQETVIALRKLKSNVILNLQITVILKMKIN